MNKDLEKFVEKCPTYIEALELLEEKDQRIAELEAKLEEVEGQYAYECGCNKQLVELQEENEKLKKELRKYSSYKTDDERIKGLQDVCGQWAEENARLKEQLKNAFCPKYKIGERKWYIEPNPVCNNELQVFDGEILEIYANALNDEKETHLFYKFDTSYGLFFDEEIFATEAEAQKYLEEHND